MISEGGVLLLRVSPKTHRDLRNIVLFSRAYLRSLFHSSTHTHCHPKPCQANRGGSREQVSLILLTQIRRYFPVSVCCLTCCHAIFTDNPPPPYQSNFRPRPTISTDLFHGLAGLKCLSTQGRIPEFHALPIHGIRFLVSTSSFAS